MKPPTLLVCVNEATVTAEHIQRDRRFCVNLLSERQIAVSQLCSRGNAPKFIDEAFLERTALPGGVIMPVLRESIASFECRAATITTSGKQLTVIGAREATIARSEERGVGKEWGETGRSRRVAVYKKKKKMTG